MAAKELGFSHHGGQEMLTPIYAGLGAAAPC